MAYLGKKYKCVKQDNFEAFLRSAGIPEEMVVKYLNDRPTSKLIKDGDTYTYISGSSDSVRQTSFKSGVEFDDKIQDRIPTKNIYTVDGNTVTQVVTLTADNASAKFVREYNGDELTVTITSTNFDGVAKRWYKLG